MPEQACGDSIRVLPGSQIEPPDHVEHCYTPFRKEGGKG